MTRAKTSAMKPSVGWVAQTNALVLPVLNKQLLDHDGYVVTRAAEEIAAFGPGAAASGARLKELLNDPLSSVRCTSADALAAITGQKLPQTVTDEKADITLDWNGMPLQMCLDFYENLSGKKVTMAAPSKSGQMLRVKTAHPLTKSAAMQLLEEVLKQQAGLVIVHSPDGSPTAVPNKPVGPF